MRRHQRIVLQMHINAISSMSRVKAWSHRVCRSGAHVTVKMNEYGTNAHTGSYRRTWTLLKPTHCMADEFGFKSVYDKPTSEGVKIKTCGADYDCSRNQKTYILVHNAMNLF